MLLPLQLSSLTCPSLHHWDLAFAKVFFWFPMLSWLTLLAILNSCASPQPSTNHVILNLSTAISVPNGEVFEGRPCIYSVPCGMPALSTAAGTWVLDKCLLNEWTFITIHAHNCSNNNTYMCMCPRSVTRSCLTLCDPMDRSPPGSSVCGVSQARILEWVAISSSRGSSWPRDLTCVSWTGRWVLYHWAPWEASEET